MKQYRLGNTVWNKTEFTNNDGDTLFLSDRVEVKLTEQELIDMGAVPVDSELNETKSDDPIDPISGFKCHCKKVKEEKIEIPKRPNGNPSTSESMNYVGDCILYLANKLNGE